MQRQVREAPFAGVETISLIDKMCSEAALLRLLAEDCLASIAVRGPLVQDQYLGLWSVLHYEKELATTSITAGVERTRTYDNFRLFDTVVPSLKSSGASWRLGQATR